MSDDITDLLGEESPRTLVWFSCGAASAAAAWYALRHRENVQVLYCDTFAEEHPDNKRFFDEVSRWLGVPIRILRSERFENVEQVWKKRRYMAGIQGAPCTVEMKKIPRFAYQRADDVHVFGFTADEVPRVKRFREQNPELNLDWILGEFKVTKDDALTLLKEVGIALPAMYTLGYKNNNCIGCVKATSARYWNMTRRDFPEVFARRAKLSRKLGAKLTRYKGKRVFLDELPSDYMPAEPLEDISCGPDCGVHEA